MVVSFEIEGRTSEVTRVMNDGRQLITPRVSVRIKIPQNITGNDLISQESFQKSSRYFCTSACSQQII